MQKFTQGSVLLGVITLAALGGILGGFAFSITAVYHGFAQGAAPLLANALGAAIGAGITLTAAEWRTTKAEAETQKKERSAQGKRAAHNVGSLAIVAHNLAVLLTTLGSSGSRFQTLAAFHAIDFRLREVTELFRFLQDLDMYDEFEALATELPYVQWLASDPDILGRVRSMSFFPHGEAEIMGGIERASRAVEAAIQALDRRKW